MNKQYRVNGKFAKNKEVTFIPESRVVKNITDPAMLKDGMLISFNTMNDDDRVESAVVSIQGRNIFALWNGKGCCYAGAPSMKGFSNSWLLNKNSHEIDSFTKDIKFLGWDTTSKADSIKIETKSEVKTEDLKKSIDLVWEEVGKAIELLDNNIHKRIDKIGHDVSLLISENINIKDRLSKLEKIDKVEVKKEIVQDNQKFKVGDKVECEWMDKHFTGEVVSIDIEIDQIEIKWMNGRICGYKTKEDFILNKVHLIKEVITPIIPKYAVNDIVLINEEGFALVITEIVPECNYKTVHTNGKVIGIYNEKDILRKIGVAC